MENSRLSHYSGRVCPYYDFSFSVCSSAAIVGHRVIALTAIVLHRVIALIAIVLHRVIALTTIVLHRVIAHTPIKHAAILIIRADAVSVFRRITTGTVVAACLCKGSTTTCGD